MSVKMVTVHQKLAFFLLIPILLLLYYYYYYYYYYCDLCSQLSDVDSDTIQRQRRELQLLIGELKDRDR